MKTFVYVVTSVHEDDMNRYMDMYKVVNEVYFTKEKAVQKVLENIQEFMTEWEISNVERETPKIYDDTFFSVYGKIWTIVETTIE